MPAYKPVRRTQLIRSFGVGAMTNFPGDETLMNAGLDFWPFAFDRCPPDWLVREERLEARLGVDHFRLPPEHREPDPGVTHPNQDIPYVGFPRWHYCHRCGGMELESLFQLHRNRCRGYPFTQGLNCSNLRETRRPRLIPVRVVAVCGEGHIQEFPFMEWIHRDTEVADDCRLRFRAGRSSAGLTGVRITCTCGKQRTLAGAFDEGALHRIGSDCRGEQPWLGRVEGTSDRCGQHLQVVQRGASNVYFPYVASSIYLPLWGEEAQRAVVRALDNPRFWGTLTNGLVDGKHIDRGRAAVVADMLGVDAEELREAAQCKLDEIPSEEQSLTEEEYRRQEYEALRNGRGGINTDLLVETRDPADYEGGVLAIFSRICLVRKLRETSVLTGFTRVLPPEADPASNRLQQLKSSPRINWLPATIVRGEGIFFEFDLSRIEEWMTNNDRTFAISRLWDAYNQTRAQRGQEPRGVTPKFVMMHTFAHALINQLSFDCGYGSSSLRERIYCNFEDEDLPMQGVLIYTASGDSEGTMGGLVRQGEPDRLPQTLMRAFRKAQWCSSDPVCIESTGQGTDNANLAACHACALVSETSWEEGNRLLDRATLVGTPGNTDQGFVSRIIELESAVL